MNVANRDKNWTSIIFGMVQIQCFGHGVLSVIVENQLT